MRVGDRAQRKFSNDNLVLLAKSARPAATPHHMLKDYCIPKNNSGSEEEFVGEFRDERWAQDVDR